MQASKIYRPAGPLRNTAPNEYVALITFLKLQNLWSHPLAWKVEKMVAK
jgi:hypothetical protein